MRESFHLHDLFDSTLEEDRGTTGSIKQKLGLTL